MLRNGAPPGLLALVVGASGSSAGGSSHEARTSGTSLPTAAGMHLSPISSLEHHAHLASAVARQAADSVAFWHALTSAAASLFCFFWFVLCFFGVWWRVREQTQKGGRAASKKKREAEEMAGRWSRARAPRRAARILAAARRK